MRTRAAASIALSYALALVSVTNALATAPAAWCRRFGTSGASSRAFGLCVDASGHAVMAGSFNGLVNFGGDDMLAQGTDIVLARYDGSGAHQWSRSFGGAMADQAYSVAFDGSGNILLTGYFQQTAYLGGSYLGSTGNSDVFVARYDGNGNHLWSRALGWAGSDVGCSVAADASGNVVVAGYANGSDILLVRYDAAGALQWMKVIGSTGYDEGLSVTTDTSGNILVTGSFSGSVDFGGGNLATSSVDEWDVFVAKYTPGGTHIWSRRFGDVDLEEGTCIRTDGSNNVIVAGYFMGSVSFGGAALVSAGSEVDLFLAKYDAGGNHLWSRRLGGSSYEYACAVAVDGSSNVFLAGYFSGTANFGGANLTSAGNIDAFFAKFDAAGNAVSSDRYGAANADAAEGIALNAAGDRYMAGFFNDTVDFGGDQLVASGTPDMFLARYGQVPSGVNDAPALDPIAITAMPNPFNPSTTIRYTVPAGGRVRVTIHDVRGQLVSTLFDEDVTVGEHAVEWRGRDETGNVAASGVYFARVARTGQAGTYKLVLLK